MVNDNKILITGGSGFIGTNILKKIKNNSSNIFATYYSNKNFYKVDNVQYIKSNLENKNECKKICKDIDIVVMCAANSSGAAVMEKTPLVHMTPNLIMNANMLEAAYEANVKKFIFISSNTVYPHVNFAVKEEDAKFDFFEKYYVVGWMKRFTEILCEIYSKKIKNKMITIIVRPGNLYGPHDKFDLEKSKVIPALIRRVIEKQNPLTVWGDGNDIKDFLFISDFSDIIIKIINTVDYHDVFNIASGKGITIKEILSEIIDLEKVFDSEIEYDSTKPTMIPIRLIDITKAKNLLGFSPKFDLRKGLELTINWYKNYYDYNKNSL